MVPRTVGNIELGPLLNEGAMGILYRGLDRRTGKAVAVKTLSPSQQESPWNDRCLRAEHALVHGIRHPNVVRFLDLIEEDGIPYLVMELVEGPDLRNRLNGSRLPLAEALEVAKGIASALQAVHEHNRKRPIVHADVKPENVMLRDTQGPLRKERVVLVDFGTALLSRERQGVLGRAVSFVQERLHGAQVVGGSSLYMSPEQASPETLAIDIRADLYSLGVVFFEMVTGRPPFLCAADERTFKDHGRVSLSAQEALLKPHYSMELRSKQCFAPPPSPRWFNPDLPEAVEDLIMTCLQKQPERRFASALDLLTALTSFRIETDGTVVSTRLHGMRAIPARTTYLLLAVGGALMGTERLLDSVAIKAGRKVLSKEGFPLPPDDKTASGEHALFENAGDHVVVTDLESSNGTFVNGRKVAKAKLKDGDRIMLGRTVIRVSAKK